METAPKKNEITVKGEVGPETLAALGSLREAIVQLRVAFERLPGQVQDVILHNPVVLASELDTLLAPGADD